MTNGDVCMFCEPRYNGQTQRGILAMNDVHRRACFELYPDVILVSASTEQI